MRTALGELSENIPSATRNDSASAGSGTGTRPRTKARGRMSSIERYFGEKVSLLSTSDVRYDGELYTADPSEQSIALKHVNCMGTEGRRSGDQVIAPSDCTYEFIIFRAVNIRDLWLEKSGGQRVNLNKEVLEPLRSGHRGAAKDALDDTPKRKVGYQSRSGGGHGQQGGYDPYYAQHPPPRDYYGGRGGYGPPPSAAYGDAEYPPPAHFRQPRGGQYHAAPHDYYGAPYFPRGYHRRGQQGGGGQSRYFQQRRQPQYYDQRRAYDQRTYYEQQGAWSRQQDRRRPYSLQYDDGRYARYGRSSSRYGGRGGDRPSGQRAGTGAFLDSHRLRGDEIDVKDQQEFDFDAAKKDFDQSKEAQMEALAHAVDSMALEAAHTASGAVANGGDGDGDGVEDGGAAASGPSRDCEENKNADDGHKYDRNVSFFDGLATETKNSKPRSDLQSQKAVDTSTFGSVAATYKSRHITRGSGRSRNGQYGAARNYGAGRRQRAYAQRSSQQYNHRAGGRESGGAKRTREQQRAHGHRQSGNQWVEKR